MVKEYKKFDKKPDTYFKHITVPHQLFEDRTVSLDIGYEQFLGPEMYFNPEIFNLKYTKSVPQLVDEAVLGCPIDLRRAMYKVRHLRGAAKVCASARSRLTLAPAVLRTSCCRAATRCSASWRAGCRRASTSECRAA